MLFRIPVSSRYRRGKPSGGAKLVVFLYFMLGYEKKNGFIGHF
jgi:hypothetical protein